MPSNCETSDSESAGCKGFINNTTVCAENSTLEVPVEGRTPNKKYLLDKYVQECDFVQNNVLSKEYFRDENVRLCAILAERHLEILNLKAEHRMQMAEKDAIIEMNMDEITVKNTKIVSLKAQLELALSQLDASQCAEMYNLGESSSHIHESSHTVCNLEEATNLLPTLARASLDRDGSSIWTYAESNVPKRSNIPPLAVTSLDNEGQGSNIPPSAACNQDEASNLLPLAASCLDNPAIARYSRQLILPEIGPKGQLALSNTAVLVVGAGGLGCPACIYLAAAGVGRLGIVDYDTVEISNLHRQILHTEERVGMGKADSIAESCRKLNSRVHCVPYHEALTSANATDIIARYDVVVDATDNVATRYLLNDACVLAGKPLVSGSALRLEGQLTVYHHAGGPCYRCLYPSPPPPETVTNCSDGGVLGVVPGLIGCLQALEVLKLAAGFGTPCSQRLLLLDATDATLRSVRLRGRQASCAVCGDAPTVTKLIDYEQFCGAAATDRCASVAIVAPSERIESREYQEVLNLGQPHVLVDVRTPVELEICRLPCEATFNLPIDLVGRAEWQERLRAFVRERASEGPIPVFVVCRRGNDSQRALAGIRACVGPLLGHPVRDLRGGLHSWARHIDASFPVY